jgi:hypothetical protein
VRLRVVVRNVPDDEEQERIETDEGDRGRDETGGEEDGGSTEQLSQIGTTDDDLLVGRVLEDRLGEDVGDIVLEVAVTKEGKGVSGDEPAELAGAKDELATDIDSLEEVDETMIDAKHKIQ